jgi:dipeptidyl-peptidase-4
VLTLLGSLCLFAAEKKPVTIDALMNQHRTAMPTPIWSPDGRLFAIVNRDKVTLYASATGASMEKDKPWFDVSALSRMAHRPAEAKNSSWRNRRVSNDSFQWSSNSKDMLAAVGGDLFLVHLNGKVDQLTRTDEEEEDPKLSPDGEHIVYRWKGNLYLLKVGNKKVSQLTTDGSATLLNGQLDWVYPEELDLGTAAWWSPDSKKVAFMQFNVAAEFVYPQVDLLGERAAAEPERYPQSGTPNATVRIGVIDIATGDIKWMNLGETANALLARVEWLPDSETVAVERLSRVQDKLELLFCDAEKGSVHRVLKEDSKTWINFMDNFFPIAGGKEFLWTSESGPGGFRHIYRYSNKGEMLRQVTQGDWEVSGISAIDDTKRLIYFVSSEAGPLESQYYSVSFDGGVPQRITKEEG